MGRLLVNGDERAVDFTPGRTLLDVLREDLGLTGAKYGCGTGECGACTVLVDGKAERACVLDCSTVDGAAVTTVEGLSAEGALHPVQAAFVAARSLQCGYCTPGMVMSAVTLLAREPAPDEAAIRAALDGNICRCGGYPRIVDAVRHAATADRLAVAVPEVEAPDGAGDAWTVVLPPMGDDAGRGWGWSTPGGARLVIDSRGRVTGFTGKVDAGQGNRAELTRLIAAELGMPTSAVLLEMGDTASAPLDLGTVGSTSTPDAGHALRLVAVAARRELLAAAASTWHVDPGGLTVAGGMVRDRADSREISFADLVAGGPRTVLADPDEPLPPAPAGLAEVDSCRLRCHLVAAVTGAKRFPSDLVLPGMLYGRVLRGPGHGAVLRTADTSAARRLPGVVVVADGDFVGVAAPTRAAADEAVRAVRAEWDTTEQPGEAELEQYLRTHLIDEGTRRVIHRETGDVGAAQAAAEVRLAATYTTAYIAHVPLEPRVALARADQDGVTVWTGTQRPFRVRDEVAEALGLPTEQVRIIVPDFGGGFGGKHFGDVAIEAARLARATGRPVKVAWTRAEEFQWAYLRPAAVIDVCGTATRSGELTSWEFTNINSGAAGLFTPYTVDHKRERFQPAESPLPRGSYRALAATANHFARESHLDELATATGTDPVDLRRRHLSDPRLMHVLDVVAERAGWAHSPRDSGRAMGIACGVEKDARVATVAEVAVDPGGDGLPRLRRILTAVDCGAVLDPDGLRLQIVGATIMGLGGALFEAIHFDAGRILNASLADYRVPRCSDIPPIDVIVVDRPDIPPAGAGETPIVTIAPAIANAIHAATGRRLRALPLDASAAG